METKDLHLLFLAKFAPKEGSNYPLATEELDGVYAQYHYDIYNILKKICPNTTCCHNVSKLLDQTNHYDYVFTLLNRAPYNNSEIFVSALLEYLKIPYLGARPNIRALAEDKHLAKMAAKFVGLETPKWITIDVNESSLSTPSFCGPYFIKPRFGAASAFIDENSIAFTWPQAIERIKLLQNNGLDIIVEEFIDGIYYSVPFYFDQNNPIYLPAVKEISTLSGNIVTYRQKRKLDSGLSRSVNLDKKLEKELILQSDKFLKVVTPLDYTRIDFIVTSTAIKFIEFNICCNLGKQSSFCISANSVGLSQEDLVTNIFINSLKRQKVII